MRISDWSSDVCSSVLKAPPAVANNELVITPVMSKADRKAFVDLPWRLYADDPHWVPPLKDEVYSLITPGKNPFFGHAEAQYFLARRGGRVVGRVSAHLDHLALAQPAEQGMGTGMGDFGLLEAEIGRASGRAREWQNG